MSTIRVFIQGDPKAQPRPKAARRGNKTIIYNPSSADGWKIQVKSAFRNYKGLNIQGPIRCDLEFQFARPQKLLRKKDPEGKIPHICKPDKDNLDKSVFDCLSAPIKKKKGNSFVLVGGINVWGDDCQVYTGETKKFYVRKGGIPGCMVTIHYDID